MKAKNLVQAWLFVEMEEDGKTLGEALNDLNEALGTAYTHSRVHEWRESRNQRGDRLPREVRVYMAKITARSVLSAAGLNMQGMTTRKITQIAEQFC